MPQTTATPPTSVAETTTVHSITNAKPDEDDAPTSASRRAASSRDRHAATNAHTGQAAPTRSPGC
jgi:hypothetical protein